MKIHVIDAFGGTIAGAIETGSDDLLKADYLELKEGYVYRLGEFPTPREGVKPAIFTDAGGAAEFRRSDVLVPPEPWFTGMGSGEIQNAAFAAILNEFQTPERGAVVLYPHEGKPWATTKAKPEKPEPQSTMPRGTTDTFDNPDAKDPRLDVGGEVGNMRPQPIADEKLKNMGAPRGPAPGAAAPAKPAPGRAR